ncbi:MAG: 3-phosphoshikimate 1-carboxyvinyltransferase [Candidatus Omnitrophota bacterium]
MKAIRWHKRLNETFVARRIKRVKGEIALAGDKSIAHRYIILSALCQGKTKIENFPFNKDCLSTLKAFQKLGVKILAQKKIGVLTVFGKGLYGLSKPKRPIFIGESGTTLRLLLGVLAGQGFSATLTAGEFLSRRPMLRVTAPLRMMGAEINGQRLPAGQAGATPACRPPAGRAGTGRGNGQTEEEYPPITIQGGNLNPITYRMPVASAQVKSAILLAGLYTRGMTSVIEPIPTRDHTERMLKLFKADIKLQQNKIVIKGKGKLISPGKVFVPGDISSAAFFMVLAAILPNSQVLINNVSLNPSRIGIIRVLKRMGVDIKVKKFRHNAWRTRQSFWRAQGHKVTKYEPMGNLIIKSSALRGARVRREEVPSLIDELPILMVAASFAKGSTVFEGVSELRVKETDRIRSMTENLTKMGADIEVVKERKFENIIITGVKQLKGTKVRSFGDHRTAMSMVIAGLAAEGQTQIDDISCINKSFPNFINILDTLMESHS